MFIQTSRTALWFAFLFLSSSIYCGAKNAPPPAGMTISVYNDANVPTDVIASAETTATRIFRQAGLEVKWLLCTPSPDPAGKTACTDVSFPGHLHVRILPRSRNLTSSTLGVSYLSADGIGCYTDIFFAPIANLHAASGPEVGPILGHVIAHEVAHLLLGTNSHSKRGIMRAQWQRQEVLSAYKGELLFTREQSQIMSRRLSRAMLTAGD